MEHNITEIKAAHIAPCGVNCATCYAFRREKNPCPGCNEPGEEGKPKHCLKCAVFTCETRLAAPEKSCAYCSIFPCKRLKQLDGRYRASYKLSLLDNLEYIHTKGVDSFLEFENSRSKCENCGAIRIIQEKACPACGWSKRLF